MAHRTKGMPATRTRSKVVAPSIRQSEALLKRAKMRKRLTLKKQLAKTKPDKLAIKPVIVKEESEDADQWSVSGQNKEDEDDDTLIGAVAMVPDKSVRRKDDGNSTLTMKQRANKFMKQLTNPEAEGKKKKEVKKTQDVTESEDSIIFYQDSTEDTTTSGGYYPMEELRQIENYTREQNKQESEEQAFKRNLHVVSDFLRQEYRQPWIDPRDRRHDYQIQYSKDRPIVVRGASRRQEYQEDDLNLIPNRKSYKYLQQQPNYKSEDDDLDHKYKEDMAVKEEDDQWLESARHSPILNENRIRYTLDTTLNGPLHSTLVYHEDMERDHSETEEEDYEIQTDPWRANCVPSAPEEESEEGLCERYNRERYLQEAKLNSTHEQTFQTAKTSSNDSLQQRIIPRIVEEQPREEIYYVNPNIQYQPRYETPPPFSL